MEPDEDLNFEVMARVSVVSKDPTIDTEALA